MDTQLKTTPKTIEILADAVYPSFAMLAGMELDVFTPLKDGPLTADQIARAAGTDPAKTAPLLHALVAIGLLKSDGDRFLNSPEADQFLVAAARLHRAAASRLSASMEFGALCGGDHSRGRATTRDGLRQYACRRS